MTWLIALITCTLLAAGGAPVDKARWQVAADPELKAELDGWLAEIERGIETGQLKGREAAEQLRLHNRTLHEARIQIYGTNPFMVFCLRYFSDSMQDRKQAPGIWVPPAWYHHMMTQALYELAHSRESVERADAEGRGMAKSTYGTEWLDIYMAAEGLRRNMIIIGAQDDKKEYQTRLRNITKQVETNQALRADYPGLAPAMDIKGQVVGYKDNEIILDCGARIAAMAMMGNIRGQSYDLQRPDHITFDDPETRKMQKSPTKMREALEWIEEDVFGSLAPGGSILWQGTLLSYHCLLGKFMTPVVDGGKGWPGVKIPLIDDDTGECNWPAFYPPEEIERLKSPQKHGPRGFAKERCLKVRLDEDAVFLVADFDNNRYYPGKLSSLGQFAIKKEPAAKDTQSRISYSPWYCAHGLAASFTQRIVGPGRWEYDGRQLTVYAHADLAVSTREGACYTAVAVIGADYSGEEPSYYLLEALRARLSQPEQLDLIERVIDFWQPVKLGLEKQSLEIALEQGITARRKLPEGFITFINRSNTDQSKLDRLASWVDPVRAGEVLFCTDEGHQSLVMLRRPMDPEPRILVQSQRVLRREADEFPHGEAIDLMDATESCYTLAKSCRPPRRGPTEPKQPNRRNSRDARYGGWR